MKTKSLGRAWYVAFLCAFGVVAAVLQGCSSGSAYNRVPATSAGRVQHLDLGTVIAVREVQIDGQATSLGVSTGAIMGSAAGQTIGKGSGRILAAAGGAAVGGVVGAMVEKEVTTKRAQEITINVDSGENVVIVQEIQDPPFIEGDRVRITTTPTGESVVAHSQYFSDFDY